MKTKNKLKHRPFAHWVTEKKLITNLTSPIGLSVISLVFQWVPAYSFTGHQFIHRLVTSSAVCGKRLKYRCDDYLTFVVD